MEPTIGKITVMTVSTNLEPIAEIAPMVGVTSELVPTQEIVGAVGASAIAGPAAGVTIEVNIKRRNGEIVWHEDRNGNAYTWVDVVVIEKATLQKSSKIETDVVAYGEAATKYLKDKFSYIKTGKRVTVQSDMRKMVPGAKTRLGEYRNGSFRPQIRKVLGKVTDTSGVQHEVVRYINTVRTVQRTEEHPYYKFNVLGFLSKERIFSGKDTRRFALPGYRVAVYQKESGLEITCSTPSKKEGGKWVDLFGKDTEQGKLMKQIVPAVELAFMQETGLVPNKRKFSATCAKCDDCKISVYGQNQEEPHARCAKGLRDTMWMGFHWEMESDYRDYVSLGNNLYLMHSEKFEAPSLPGRLQYPIDPDTKKPMTREKAMETMVTSQPRIYDGKKWVETTPETHAPVTRSVHDTAILMMDVQGTAGYEVPRWLTPEKMVAMYHDFASAMETDLFTADRKHIAMLKASMEKMKARGKDGIAADLARELKAATNKLRSDRRMMFGDSMAPFEFEEVVDRVLEMEDMGTPLYGLARFESGMSFIDVASDGFISSDDDDIKVDADEDYGSLFTGAQFLGEVERDSVPDLEMMGQLLQLTHPLFRDFALEVGITRNVRDMFPTVLTRMQDHIPAESNPRMIKAGSSSDIIREAFDGDPCLWFNWEGSRRPAYGIANFMIHSS
jgi:hypothetical protein